MSISYTQSSYNDSDATVSDSSHVQSPSTIPHNIHITPHQDHDNQQHNNGVPPNITMSMLPPFPHIPPFVAPPSSLPTDSSHHNNMESHIPPISLLALLPPPPVDIKSLPPPPVVDSHKSEHNLYLEKLDYEIQYKITQYIRNFMNLSYPMQLQSIISPPHYITDKHVADAISSVRPQQQMLLLKQLNKHKQKSIIKQMSTQQRTHLYQSIAQRKHSQNHNHSDVNSNSTPATGTDDKLQQSEPAAMQFSDDVDDFSYVPTRLRHIDMTNQSPIISSIQSITYGFGNIYNQVNIYSFHLIELHIHEWLHTLCSKHIVHYKRRYKNVLFALYPLQCLQYYRYKKIRKAYVDSGLNNDEIESNIQSALNDNDIIEQAGITSNSPDTSPTLSAVRRSARVAAPFLSKQTELESESDAELSEDDTTELNVTNVGTSGQTTTVDNYHIDKYNIDINNKSRLQFLDTIANSLDDDEYIKFNTARQTSFSNTRQKKKLFNELINVEYKLSSALINLLNYLAVDRIGMLAQLCVYLRQHGEYSHSTVSWQCNEIQAAMDALETNEYTSINKLNTISTPFMSSKLVKQQIQSIKLPVFNHPAVHTTIDINSIDHDTTTSIASSSPVLDSNVSDDNLPSYHYDANDITRIDDALAAALLNQPVSVNKLFERSSELPAHVHTETHEQLSLPDIPAADNASTSDAPTMVSPPIPPLESAFTPPSASLNQSNNNNNNTIYDQTYQLVIDAHHSTKTMPTDDQHKNSMPISMTPYNLQFTSDQSTPHQSTKSSSKRPISSIDSDDNVYDGGSISSSSNKRRSSNIGKGAKQKFPESIHKMMHTFAVALNWKFKIKSPVVREFEQVSGMKPLQLRSWIQNNKPAVLKRTFNADNINHHQNNNNNANENNNNINIHQTSNHHYMDDDSE